MHIQIDLESMKSISSQLNRMQQHVEAIETDYKLTSSEINSGIKKNDIQLMLIEVERDLRQLKLNTSAYGDTLNQALQTYRQSEKTVTQLYHELRQENTDKRCTTYNVINKHTIKSESIKLKNMSCPCPLPKKQQFENAEIYAGSIQNGDNILVRSWKKKDKMHPLQ